MMSLFWCPDAVAPERARRVYGTLTCVSIRRRPSLGKTGKHSARRFVARIATTDERFELGPHRLAAITIPDRRFSGTGPTDVASDGLLDARTAQASAHVGGSPEMSVVDR